MKSFGNWDTQDLREAFSLVESESLQTLSEWLNATHIPSQKETEMLQFLEEKIIEFEEDWNEEELKMNFISPIMLLVGYGVKNNYNAFFQRSLNAAVEGNEIGGIVDMVVASGWTKPIKPYFFLHEYKQDQATNKGNARGQLLAAMLTAQALNANEKPLFGVYLVGASWRFLVLEGKNYAVKRFDATEKEDLFQIFAMLKWIKVYIEKDLGLI
jgi:hypothetical protein